MVENKMDQRYQVDSKLDLDVRIKNIEYEYLKSSNVEIAKTNKKSREFAKELKLEKRMQKYTTTDSFFTYKDQKEDFLIRPQCRVLNTAKNPLGKVVKSKI